MNTRIRVDKNSLTPTEIKVLGLRQIGKEVKEVAQILNQSPSTVQNHMTSIIKKGHWKRWGRPMNA